MSTMWAFDNIENKYSLYHGKDCMKKFCNSLREHATSVINFERNKMSPLIKKKRTTFTSRCNITLHLWKKIPTAV